MRTFFGRLAVAASKVRGNSNTPNTLTTASTVLLLISVIEPCPLGILASRHPIDLTNAGIDRFSKASQLISKNTGVFSDPWGKGNRERVGAAGSPAGDGTANIVWE